MALPPQPEQHHLSHLHSGPLSMHAHALLAPYVTCHECVVTAMAALTRQGMMAVKPGLLGEVPEAVKASWPALKLAVVRAKVQSGDRERRKWRAT